MKRTLFTSALALCCAIVFSANANASGRYEPSYLPAAAQSGAFVPGSVELCYDVGLEIFVESWYWDGGSRIYLVPTEETRSCNLYL